MTPTLCACVCECTHNGISFSSFLLYFPFSENSLCLSQSVLYMPQVVTDKTRLHFLSRACPLLLQPCLLLWQHLPTVKKMTFQKGLQTSCKHHLLFPLHPKHRWQKGSFLLHVEHHLPSKLPQWHKTRDNGVMLTSLMNRRITKFLYNQQAVDLSRMSTQMTKKDIAQSDWIIPEIVQWKMGRRCRRRQEQAPTLNHSPCFIFCTWSHTGQRHWLIPVWIKRATTTKTQNVSSFYRVSDESRLA